MSSVLTASRIGNPFNAHSIEDGFYKSIQEYIDKREFAQAKEVLVASVNKLSVSRNTDAIKKFYVFLIKLIPSFTSLDFTPETPLASILQYSSHLHDEQMNLALELGKWYVQHIERQRSIDFSDLLSFSQSAMYFFAKAIQIAEIHGQNELKTIHKLASKLFVRIIMERRAYQNYLHLALDKNLPGDWFERFENRFFEIDDQTAKLIAFCGDGTEAKLFIKFINEQAQLELNKIDFKIGDRSRLDEKINQRYAEIDDLTETFELPKHTPTERYKSALLEFRRSFDALQSNVDVRTLQAEVMKAFRKFFQLMHEDVLLILGQPPCEYEIRAMGSVGRGEICPFSDLEMEIRLANFKGGSRNYFIDYIRVLKLALVSLGESETTMPVFTCIHKSNPRGIRIDVGGDPSIDLDLIQTPQSMATFQSKEVIHFKTIENTMLHSTSLVNSTTTKCNSVKELDESFTLLEPLNLSEEFDHNLYDPVEGVLKAPQRLQRCLHFFTHRLDDYLRIWKQPFAVQGGIIDIKADYYEPLFLLNDLAFYFNIAKKNSLDIIEELVSKQVFTSPSGQLIKELLEIVYKMRVRIQLHNKTQKEREQISYGQLSFQHQFLSMSSSEKENLEKGYWLVLRPLYLSLKKIVEEGNPLEKTFHNLDLVQVSFEEDFESLPWHSWQPFLNAVYSINASLTNSRGRTILHLAAAVGDFAKVKQLIAMGAPLKAKDMFGNTALMFAAHFNRRNIFEYLYEHGKYSLSECEGLLNGALSQQAYDIAFFLIWKGWRISAISKEAVFHLLCHACSDREKSSKRVKSEVVKTILQQVTTFDLSAQTSKMQVSLFHITAEAQNYLVLKVLIDYALSNLTPAQVAAILNLPDKKGDSALHRGIFSADCAYLLVKYGADITLRNNDNYRPIDIAGEKFLGTTLRLLWRKKLVDPSLLLDRDYLLFCCCQDGLETVGMPLIPVLSEKKELLFWHESRDKKTYFHEACRSGNALLARELANEKIFWDSIDGFGRYPLHWACENKLETVCHQIISSTKTLEQLNRCDNENATPLLLAIRGGSSEIVLALIKKGVNVSTTDVSGRSPLHASLDAQMSDAAWQIIDKATDIDVPDLYGYTPIVLAVENGFEEVALCIEKKISELSIGTRQTRLGISLFQLACEKGMWNLASALYKRGSDPFILNVQLRATFYRKACHAELSDHPELADDSKQTDKPLVARRGDSLDPILTKVNWCCQHGKVRALQSLIAEHFPDKLFGEILKEMVDISVTDYVSLFRSREASLVQDFPSWFQDLEMLYRSVTHGHFALFKFLVRLEVLKPSQKEAFILVRCWKSPHILKQLKMFESFGFSIMQPDDEGNYPLHWAVQFPNTAHVIQYLINQGEDPNKANLQGVTALDLVKRSGNKHYEALFR